jgi:hypothetical protein
MTSELEKSMTNLVGPERNRLEAAFAADPALAQGLTAMLADLPADTRKLLMRHLAVRLDEAALGGGAFILALGDVIFEALARWEHDAR